MDRVSVVLRRAEGRRLVTARNLLALRTEQQQRTCPSLQCGHGHPGNPPGSEVGVRARALHRVRPLRGCCKRFCTPTSVRRRGAEYPAIGANLLAQGLCSPLCPTNQTQKSRHNKTTFHLAERTWPSSPSLETTPWFNRSGKDFSPRPSRRASEAWNGSAPGAEGPGPSRPPWRCSGRPR